jgi:hypothetical protein
MVDVDDGRWTCIDFVVALFVSDKRQTRRQGSKIKGTRKIEPLTLLAASGKLYDL